MKTLKIILVITLALISLNGCASSKNSTDLSMDITKHIPIIEAKINGKGPFRFAFDTGFSGKVEITTTLAKQLEMPVNGEIKVGDPSGRNPQTVRTYTANSFDIGSEHFKDVSISESNRSNPGNTDGVIGLSLFQGMLVKLDYVNSKFTVTNGSLSQKKSLAYSNEHGVPCITIDVNGINMQVDIDSGGPAEVQLPLSTSDSLPLTSKIQKTGKGMTADGEFDIYSSVLNGKVYVGNILLTNPKIDFNSVFPNGSLGYEFLKNLIITFDTGNKRVQFEKNL